MCNPHPLIPRRSNVGMGMLVINRAPLSDALVLVEMVKPFFGGRNWVSSLFVPLFFWVELVELTRSKLTGHGTQW